MNCYVVNDDRYVDGNVDDDRTAMIILSATLIRNETWGFTSTETIKVY